MPGADVMCSAYREYAVAAMLATGAPDFADIVGPLLSSEDQQVRLETYRLRPGFHVTSLGENWPFVVRGWIESAREDFVAELLQHRADADVVELAARDDSERVKKAAASGLIWTGSEDALVSLVDTMSSRTFDEFVVNWQGELPRALRPRAIAAMRNQLSKAKDPAACLRMARSLIGLGEAGLADTIKDALLAIPDADIHRMSEHYIRPALTYLGGVDAAWTSSWVADQLSRGTLFNHEYWLPLAPAIPPEFAAACLDRLETEDLDGHGVEGICAIIARDADAAVAGQIFVSIRNLQQVIDRAVAVQPVLETSLKRQLENAFRMLPGDVAVEGVLASVQAGNPDDLRVATNLLSRVARLDRTPLHIASADLSGRLRAYLKSSVSVVLAHDDFRGEEKAHLASAIAQVGEPEDVADLVTLIRADINRMRIGRAVRARGERNGAAEGAPMTYAMWHVAALAHFAPNDTLEVLIGLLQEPEYLVDVVNELIREFVDQPARVYARPLSYESVWKARERPEATVGDAGRRSRVRSALLDEVSRQRQRGQPDGLLTLAKALAVVDARNSAAIVIEIISEPGRWGHYVSVDAAERLLTAGVVLPAPSMLAIVDGYLTDNRPCQDSEKVLLCRMLALCLLSDDQQAGVVKVREVIGASYIRGYALRTVVDALGASRDEAAVDLLIELASDVGTFDQLHDNLLSAFAASRTQRGEEILLSVVDPDAVGIAFQMRKHHEFGFVARLVQLAKRDSEIAVRLRRLCARDLPEFARHTLSQVLDSMGKPEDRVASLMLIRDGQQVSVPRGVWDSLRASFVEQRPYGGTGNMYTEHARAANDLRGELFRMAIDDAGRLMAASKLLGQIEVWRLEYGRPTEEPRHPNLASGLRWPPE